MLVSYSLLAYCAAFVVALYLLLNPFIQYLRDPLRLRKYPAPSFLAGLTPLWLIKATWTQSRSQILHREFLRLGDVVRVSPNHIIFNDPAAIKDIYGVLAASKGILKDEFYHRLSESHDLVQIRDRAEHSDRRKALANAFAAKTVVNMESIIRKTLGQLFHIIDEHIDRQDDKIPTPLNLRHWLNFFTLDVIGDTGFGIPMGFLKQTSDSTHAESWEGKIYPVNEMINTLHRGVRYGLVIGNITSIRLVRVLKYLIASCPPLAKSLGKTCGDDFEAICIGKLRKRISEGTPDRPSVDFIDFILNDKKRSANSEDGTGNKHFSEEQFRSLVADSAMMMNAGSDTTAAALTNTIWYLLQTPSALARLREELAPLRAGHGAHPSVEESMFSYDSVKDLPYLRACIDESLRLRPPIAYQLPRMVSKTPVNIAGHDVLPGTVVAVAPWSVHRHPTLFKAPDDYHPERWVDLDQDFPNQMDDLKKYNIVFSQGSRACIGRHLAIVELQVLISSLFMRYDVDLTEESAKELKIFERFNSNPGPMPILIRERKAAALNYDRWVIGELSMKA